MKNLKVNGDTATAAVRPDAACTAVGVRSAPADVGEASSLTAGGGPACGAAPAGRRREAPALDLSLGHFGTSAYVDEIDYVSEGPYTLELDYLGMTATLTMDRADPSSRAVRRASMRKFEKVIRVASQSGMRIVREAV